KLESGLRPAGPLSELVAGGGFEPPIPLGGIMSVDDRRELDLSPSFRRILSRLSASSIHSLAVAPPRNRAEVLYEQFSKAGSAPPNASAPSRYVVPGGNRGLQQSPYRNVAPSHSKGRIQSMVCLKLA